MYTTLTKLAMVCALALAGLAFVPSASAEISEGGGDCTYNIGGTCGPNGSCYMNIAGDCDGDCDYNIYATCEEGAECPVNVVATCEALSWIEVGIKA